MDEQANIQTEDEKRERTFSGRPYGEGQMTVSLKTYRIYSTGSSAPYCPSSSLP